MKFTNSHLPTYNIYTNWHKKQEKKLIEKIQLMFDVLDDCVSELRSGVISSHISGLHLKFEKKNVANWTDHIVPHVQSAVLSASVKSPNFCHFRTQD